MFEWGGVAWCVLLSFLSLYVFREEADWVPGIATSVILHSSTNSSSTSAINPTRFFFNKRTINSIITNKATELGIETEFGNEGEGEREGEGRVGVECGGEGEESEEEEGENGFGG